MKYYRRVDLPDDALIADGLDEAIIGYENEKVIYDYNKCVEVFMKDNEWDWETAVEWMEFNVVGAYVGPKTPLFIDPDAEDEED